MNHLTYAKSPKIDDQKWGCIAMNTIPFLIIDFRLIWRGEMVHFIFRQFLILPQNQANMIWVS